MRLRTLKSWRGSCCVVSEFHFPSASFFLAVVWLSPPPPVELFHLCPH